MIQKCEKMVEIFCEHYPDVSIIIWNEKNNHKAQAKPSLM
jgi:hypothetical protein